MVGAGSCQGRYRAETAAGTGGSCGASQGKDTKIAEDRYSSIFNQTRRYTPSHGTRLVHYI